jgi:predicted transcriptional regulator
LTLFRGRCRREVKAEGLEVRSLAEDLPEIDSRFVVVVGDRELTERLHVVYMSEEEAEEFFRYLKEALSRVSSA